MTMGRTEYDEAGGRLSRAIARRTVTTKMDRTLSATRPQNDESPASQRQKEQPAEAQNDVLSLRKNLS
jgi:hypothetical protein